MIELDKIIAKISDNTGHLTYELIQNILINSKRCKNPTEHNIGNWTKIADILWFHIKKGLEKTDDQLLCTTCFFSVLLLTDRQDSFLETVYEVIQSDVNARSAEIKDSSNTFLAVSLMYGIFQSSFLTQTTSSVNPAIINSIFCLLIQIGYEYSQHTAIVFKIMNSFKKVCGTHLQDIIFSEQNQVALLNLINHNWENPITGVRDLNKEIFQTLLTVLDDSKLNVIIKEVNGYYWNKAKYLMLSEIICQHNSEITDLIAQCDLIEGLINSLHKPGLVSAGTDIYYAILSKIHTELMWCNLFLSPVLEVLKGSSSKAIENFTNYWSIRTFKEFPALLNILIDELDKFEDIELKLYSVISILKQGSKLAILTINWELPDQLDSNKKVVLRAIEHCNTHIRMLAFDIICLSQDNKLPCEIEYSLILEYIKNNINSDCTVLRLNMLNSFSLFLGQIHLLFRNLKGENAEAKSLLLDFCKKLQQFVITSLNSNGNYQRKTTNVKLLKIFIDYISDIPRKKKNYVKCDGLSLRKYLEGNKCLLLYNEDFELKLMSLLRDPSDDIRENVGNLLLAHYSDQMRKTDIMNNLIQEALISMKSKFFYEICCGQTMFKLLVNLLLREKHPEATFKSIDEIFNYALKDLFEQYELKLNVLKSIQGGKQLHSYLNILQVVLEGTQDNSYKLNIGEENMEKLLEILKGITEQFTFKQVNATSSDFSKMNEVVEEIIAKAGSSGQNVDRDNTKISGVHQIVLNCLWLNVKACCELASILINFNKDDEQKCEKCLTIITHVLESSRHKGAIEAAGCALGSGIRFLTSLPVDSKVSKLPQTLLKSKLHTMIHEASKMASITRRGAGLSIMVHRIVSSDMQKGKPLFHYFIQTLLKTCDDMKDIPILQDDLNIENQMDLPKAILIHFLSRIVTDSSLASDMMFYSAQLAELAFSNLTSSHWQIRNAALQLYGALIPKLIGQRKQSGTDDEIMATVAYDELRTHSPKLWKFITEQLRNEHCTDKINSHSNLVPVLNMLASSAKRYNFSYDLKETKKSDEELLKSLIRVLNSPIHTVRRLASKCIFNIFSSQTIYDVIITLDISSENLLHGVLLLLKSCHKYFNLSQRRNLQEKYKYLYKDKKHSYWSKEVFMSIFPNALTINDLLDIVSELKGNVNSPGIYVWTQTCIKSLVMSSQWEDLPKILDLLFEANLEMCYDILLHKLETQKCSDSILQQIAELLLAAKHKEQNGVIWEVLHRISQAVELKNFDLTSVVSILLNQGETPSKIKYIIPFTARFIDKLKPEHQNYIVEEIYRMSDFENMDVDMRYIAALASNYLAKSIAKISEERKVIILKTVIVLLQDEDEDVRTVSVNFYKNICDLRDALHPSITLNRMLDKSFLMEVTSQETVAKLCEDILQILSNNIHKNTDEYNPFANNSKNIYLEADLLRSSLENLKVIVTHQ